MNKAREVAFKVLQYAALGYIAYVLAQRLSLGHWVMIGMLAAMIVAHEFGHWIIARLCGFKVDTFSVGFGSSPRLYLGKLWGTEFQITPWLAGGYVSINPMDEEFAKSPARHRAAVLFAGPLMNLLLAIGLIFVSFAVVGQPVPHFDRVSVQGLSDQVTIARDAGLQVGDKIVSIGGNNVTNVQEMRKAFGDAKGSKTAVVVERAGQLVTLNMVPSPQGLVGLMAEQKVLSLDYQPLGIAESAKRAVVMPVDMCGKMVWGIGLMTGLVERPPEIPAEATEVHGIVAIVQWGAAALEQGWFSFLMTLAMINLNLFFLNLLPIPVLDGGHLLFIAWEKVTGRKVSPEVYGALCTIFALLLFALMFYALYNDFARPVRFR